MEAIEVNEKNSLLSTGITGIIVAAALTMLGYIGVNNVSMTEGLAEIRTLQIQNSTHLNEFIEMVNENTERLNSVDSYMDIHEEYARGSVELINQKIAFNMSKTDSRCENLKSLIATKSNDRFTGTQGRAMQALNDERYQSTRTLIDERYSTVSRRLKEIESSINEHISHHKKTE